MGLRESISIDVQKLADVHGRSLRAPAIQHWVNRLEPLAERASYRRTMNEFLDGGRFPALADVVAQIQASSSQEWKGPKEAGARSPAADQAAIMSMLWLYYECAWSLSSFSGHVLGRAFGKDPQEALTAALEIYDREQVRQWMEIEIRKGN